MKAKVEPYDTEMGVYWRIVNTETNEVIDDSFESSADTEMHCFDNNIEIDVLD